jgi:hypothetical protein
MTAARKPSTKARIYETKGREKLQSFLDDNGISHAEAARGIGVSAPMVFDYLAGKKRPSDGARRKAIEAWTGGKVRSTDWLLPGEEHFARVRPFEKVS